MELDESTRPKGRPRGGGRWFWWGQVPFRKYNVELAMAHQTYDRRSGAKPPARLPLRAEARWNERRRRSTK